MARSRGVFVRYWLPVLAWMAVILFGTSVSPPLGLPMVSGGDKLAHGAAYAVLGLLLLRAFRSVSRWAAPRAVFASLLVGGSYGVLDELHQALLPTRTCSAADLLADLVGLIAAVMLCWAVARRLEKPRREGRAPGTSIVAEEMSNVADVQELTQADFDNEILNSEVPCLVDFWAPWCGPCHMVSPTVEKMGEEYEGRLKVGKVNLDEHFELANRYGIRAIPAVLLFNGGELVDMIIGVQPEGAFREAIDKVLGH